MKAPSVTLVINHLFRYEKNPCFPHAPAATVSLF